jgi:ectoine hydroxylase-related dioxygenase (phytanoyl-CoA dioxygenase family)
VLAGRFHDDQFLWRRHDTFRDFVFNSQAAALAQAVTGSQGMHIFYDQLFVKEPGTKTATPWHTGALQTQSASRMLSFVALRAADAAARRCTPLHAADHSYWQLTGGAVCSLWAPLDFVPGATAVRYVAGSHKWGLKHQISSFSGDAGRYAASSALPPLPDIDALESAGEVKVLRWDVSPGDVIIFDSFIVHGAPGNASASVRRRAYATRWANEAARFDARPGTMHYTWVRLAQQQFTLLTACALLHAASLTRHARMRAQKEKAKLDCGLADGATLESDLHPRIQVAL